MRVAYNGMWTPFDPQNNWFNTAFKHYFSDDSIEFSLDIHGADIIVSSVFGPQDVSAISAKKIFFTGEARTFGYTPDQSLIGFSTEKTDNVYRYPLWKLFINWWDDPLLATSNPPGYTVDLDRLCRPANAEEIAGFMDRGKFCCTIMSNPVPLRVMAHTTLWTEVDEVDGYGAAFGMYDPRPKLDLLNNYKFNLCFENTLSDGYVTEKLFEAKLGGCIPIYWGDEACKKDFNPASFIYANDFPSLENLAAHVKKVYESPELLAEMFSEPMFLTRPDVQEIYDIFDSIGLK